MTQREPWSDKDKKKRKEIYWWQNRSHRREKVNMFVTQNNSATEQFNIQLPLTRAALVRQTKIDRTRATTIFPFSLSLSRSRLLLVRMTQKITVRYAVQPYFVFYLGVSFASLGSIGNSIWQRVMRRNFWDFFESRTRLWGPPPPFAQRFSERDP